MVEAGIDVKALVDLYRVYREMWANTEFIGISPRSGVQVTELGLVEIAPVEEWKLSDRPYREYPYMASVTVDGVVFFTLLSRAEREAALDGTLFQGR